MNKKDIIWLSVIACLALISLKPKTPPMPPKGSPVIHFEIGCRDLAKTKEFYTDLFGWDASNIGPAENFNTNSKEGIQGHLTALGHEPNNYVTVYIQVDDIKGTLSRIEAAGGKKVIGPFPLPDKRQFAWFTDPEGNMIGLLTAQ
jgi:predicted enzyme related to lactoylglutathione lyase